MIELNGYDEVQEAMPGDFSALPQLPPGGYVCQIVNVEVTNSKSGKPMLVLFTDIAQGEFKGYFKASSERIKKFNPNKRWDNNAIYRQLIFSDDGKVSGFLKSLLTCFRLSNPNSFTFNPKAFDEQRLRGLTLGFVFAPTEYKKKDGSIATHAVIQFPKTVDDILNNKFSVPEIKKIEEPKKSDSNPSDFGGVPVSDFDVPF